MRKFIVIALLLAIVVAGVTIVNLQRRGATPAIDWRIKGRQPPKEVQLERPRRARIVETVTAPGTIELVDEADIASQIVGKVEAVNVEKGDYVRKDDLLVKLDDEDAKARLASTEARIESLESAIEIAKADLEKAMRDLESYQQLAERGFSTPIEINDGVTLVAKMQASLEMRQSELKESFAARRTSQQAVEFTEIRAPIDGTVIDLDVEVGEVVIAGTTNLPGTVLMTIGDMDHVRVRADVDETDVVRIKPKQPARIYLQAQQEKPIAGQVELIAPKGTRLGEVVSFETLIAVTGSHESLRPEMTATVEIEVRRAEDALSVPVQAVMHRRLKDLPDTPLFRDWVASRPKRPEEKGRDDRTRYVKVAFLKVGEVARARPVETGIADLERVEIRSGLSPDDDVIVGPFRALDEMKDGQPVKKLVPKKKAPADAAKKLSKSAQTDATDPNDQSAGNDTKPGAAKTAEDAEPEAADQPDARDEPDASDSSSKPTESDDVDEPDQQDQPSGDDTPSERDESAAAEPAESKSAAGTKSKTAAQDEGERAS